MGTSMLIRSPIHNQVSDYHAKIAEHILNMIETISNSFPPSQRLREIER